MNSFPILRTGVMAQYPLTTARRFDTKVLEFVDGAEQRFPLMGASLTGWVLVYSQLDEAEMHALRTFVLSALECGEYFPFKDPETNVVHSKCRIAHAELSESWKGDGQGQTRIEIVEVKD